MSTNAEILARARQLHLRGNVTHALQLYRQALQQTPNDLDALYACGEAYQELRMFQQAAECFQRILQVQPSHAEACTKLGNVLLVQGNLDGAAERYQLALRLQPNHTEAHNNLGEVFVYQGKDDQALACFQHAVAIQPTEAVFHYNVGKTLKALKRSSEAIASFREAVRLRPDFGEALTKLGLLLVADSEYDEALVCFEQAARVLPREAVVHSNLGNALLEAGNKKAASQHFREALRLDPDCIQALSRVAFTDLFRLSRDQLERIKLLLTQPQLRPRDASMLHFAYAHIRDRAKDYDEAFYHFREGNSLRRRLFHQAGKAFNSHEHQQWIDRLVDTFTPAYFQGVEGAGLASQVPLFVIGMPRSGTTLVEQILSQHASVFGAGELQDFHRLVEALPGRSNTVESYPACVTDIDRQTIHNLAEEHLQRLTKLDQGASFVVDKMPLNFLHLGLIATLFPNARIIHCRRDPLDSCLSCYFQFFPGMNFAWDLGDLGAFYRQYVRLMAHWGEVLPLRMMEVQYEDLVSNQEAVSRQMVAFCGLDWDDRFLAFHDNPRRVHTASTLQVRRPIYTTSVRRWQCYAKYLQPLIDSLAGAGEMN
jgi:tetratricopeptide (TPR) repeat protein